MKVIDGLNNIKRALRGPVIVTIGTFDGVHIAHQKIIRKVVDTASRLRGTSAVVTFDAPPRKLTSPHAKTALLVSLSHKLRLIGELGVDICVLLKFTKRLSSLPPEDFVRDILVEKLSAAEVVAGYDYRFGSNREGDTELLRRLGRRHNFKVSIVGPVRLEGSQVSSTRIRNLIESGRLSAAAKLLGRPVSIFGTVVKGRSWGRRLGYPTANINPHHEAIPPRGVYCVRADMGRREYTGILNIGRRPTFGGGGEKIEAHLLDYEGNLYGKEIQLYFIRKMRNERKFSTKDALAAQLRRDEANARQIARDI